MDGAKRLLLIHNGREIARLEKDLGPLKIDTAMIGAGPATLHVIGVGEADGIEHRVASAPIRVEVPIK
jgi:hypothetical protein